MTGPPRSPRQPALTARAVSVWHELKAGLVGLLRDLFGLDGPTWRALVMATGLGAILIGTSLVIAAGDPTAVCLNLALLLAGAATGWLLGLLAWGEADPAAPPSPLVKGAALFCAGLLVGRLDRLLSVLLAPEVFFRPQTLFRVCTFLTVAMLTAARARSRDR